MKQEVFDAIQELKEIGIVGAHEHFRDGNLAYKYTIEEGLKHAEALGFKVVCDMPNTDPANINEAVLLARLAAAQKSKHKKVKYMAWVGLTADPWQIEQAVRLWRLYPQVVGLKMFAGKSIQDIAIITKDEQRLVYQRLTKLGFTGIIAVHCEDEAYIFEDRYYLKKPWTHALARPKIAEIFSVDQQIRLVKETGFQGGLHICHVSAHESVEIIDAARKRGMRISCGITPHHLLYPTEQMEKMGRKSVLLKCNPPIRMESNRLLMIEDLRTGKIDIIETDHAPHTFAEKFLNGPSGVMSIFLLPRLYIEMKKWDFTDQQIIDLLRENALKIFLKIQTQINSSA